SKLTRIPGVELAYEAPHFNEFLLRLAAPFTPEAINEAMRRRGILAGIAMKPMYSDLSDCLLVAVTEKNSPDELDSYIAAFEACLAELSKTGAATQAKSDSLAISS